MPNNQTRNDAYERITLARTGSMVGATDDYLTWLTHFLHVWIGDLNAEMAERANAEKRNTESLSA